MRFDELELEDSLLQGLDAMNFQETTPIQELTIPVILEGKDLIACAQTGTGKTAAYTLPILNRLIKEENRTDTVKAVIMAPTRELAQQIDIPRFNGCRLRRGGWKFMGSTEESVTLRCGCCHRNTGTIDRTSTTQ